LESNNLVDHRKFENMFLWIKKWKARIGFSVGVFSYRMFQLIYRDGSSLIGYLGTKLVKQVVNIVLPFLTCKCKYIEIENISVTDF